MLFNSGFIICTFIYVSNNIYGKEIDLIANIGNLPKSYVQNFNLRHERFPVKTLNLTDNKQRDLQLIKTVSKEILDFFTTRKDFSLCIELRQDQAKYGTVFSITDGKNTRLWEISISLKKEEIRIIYSLSLSFGSLKKKIQYSLLETQWHILCLEHLIKKQLILVKSDCFNEVRNIIMYPLNYKMLKSNDVRIYIGQRSPTKSYFQGVIKRMTLSTKANYSVEFCAPPKRKPIISSKVSNLNIESIENRLNLLEREVTDLKMKLLESNSKLSELEKCKCLPVCASSSGENRQLFEKWQENNNCQNCSCTEYGTKCVQEQCPELDCLHKVFVEGKCCPRCGKSCHHQMEIYSHAQNFTASCKACYCNDGSLNCRTINAGFGCPKLNCSRSEQIKIPGSCCKQCKINKFCYCGANAFCTTSSVIFKCQCKSGFQGDPFVKCEDINECENRLICPPSTSCVNSEGSFKCICNPGYIRLNHSSPNCEPVCIKNRCKNNSTCAAPDKCECAVGFTGPQCDIPLCNKNECKNNSTCVAPDKCECAVGFTGPHCDIDVDECKLGIIKCPANSRCLNIHGSYICKCLNGYKSKENGKISIYYDYQCKDVDECSGIRGSDYICDIHSDCVNTPGGYTCISKNTQEEKNCKIETVTNKIESLYNEQTISHAPSCMECKCLNGKVFCSGIQCNCKTEQPKSCCRNCYPNKCSLSYKENSEFQGFTCMLNNTLCAKKECPKLFCPESLDLLGHCCKLCRNDHITSCMLQYNISISSVDIYSDLSNSCYYQDKIYENGEKFILQNYSDGSCLKCLCWNQSFCCAKSISCII